jgi:hypothetical protein
MGSPVLRPFVFIALDQASLKRIMLEAGIHSDESCRNMSKTCRNFAHPARPIFDLDRRNRRHPQNMPRQPRNTPLIFYIRLSGAAQRQIAAIHEPGLPPAHGA